MCIRDRSNLSQTLHSSAKSKNKQVANIWSIYLYKQKSGPKIRFPEGLENTPFTLIKLKWGVFRGPDFYTVDLKGHYFYTLKSKITRVSLFWSKHFLHGPEPSAGSGPGHSLLPKSDKNKQKVHIDPMLSHTPGHTLEPLIIDTPYPRGIDDYAFMYKTI